MKRAASSVPTFDSMLLPTIQALQILGGSGTTEEIYDIIDSQAHARKLRHEAETRNRA